mmetsp:Transcript_9710/g.11595  ORF Transcript_9710/g.11595 Transcript_9710/m.11595 type:complete len:367 (+) Transcript_9710:204-1304(+)|eukprot:jgi/Bigna1/88468/estExt_fgenesh1_pg.C_320098
MYQNQFSMDGMDGMDMWETPGKRMNKRRKRKAKKADDRSAMMQNRKEIVRTPTEEAIIESHTRRCQSKKYVELHCSMEDGIPEDVHEELLNALKRQRGDFRHGLDKDAKLSLKRLKEKHKDIRLSLSQARSLKSRLARLAATNNQKEIMEKQARILEDHEAGVSLGQLSRQYDAPPNNLRKLIYGAKGFNKEQIKEMMVSPDKSSLLSEKEKKEALSAMEQDQTASTNQRKKKRIARGFEQKLLNKFRALKIEICTEDDIKACKKKKKGQLKNIPTPDFLLLDDVFLNGQHIKWIDAKCFYGCSLDSKSIKKTIEKYNKHFGPGLLVFKHGFTRSLRNKFPGTLFAEVSTLTECMGSGKIKIKTLE